MTNRTYLLGTALDVFGFVLTAIAARQLALFAVEGILATGVGFTAVLAAWLLKERLGNPAKLAVMSMMVGLVLLAVSAAPETGHTLGLPLWVIGLSVISLMVLTIMIDHMPTSPATPSLLAMMAGLSFGAWAAIPRLTHDGVAANAVGAVFVVVGLASYAAGLRRGTAVAVMAITVAAESILPALCGLAVGDTARPGLGAAAVAGFVLSVASAVLIAIVDRETCWTSTHGAASEARRRVVGDRGAALTSQRGSRHRTSSRSDDASDAAIVPSRPIGSPAVRAALSQQPSIALDAATARSSIVVAVELDTEVFERRPSTVSAMWSTPARYSCIDAAATVSLQIPYGTSPSHAAQRMP